MQGAGRRREGRGVEGGEEGEVGEEGGWREGRRGGGRRRGVEEHTSIDKN